MINLPPQMLWQHMGPVGPREIHRVIGVDQEEGEIITSSIEFASPGHSWLGGWEQFQRVFREVRVGKGPD